LGSCDDDQPAGSNITRQTTTSVESFDNKALSSTITPATSSSTNTTTNTNITEATTTSTVTELSELVTYVGYKNIFHLKIFIFILKMRAMGKITSFERCNERQISTELYSLNETKAIELLKQVGNTPCILQKYNLIPEKIFFLFPKEMFSGKFFLILFIFRKGINLFLFTERL